MKLKIKVKYHDEEIPKLRAAHDGEWIDMAVAEDYELEAGEFYLLNLGVSIEVPKGYEAILAPRSGTFKKYGVIQTNSIGVIDNAYSGDGDVWMMPVMATEDVTIAKGTRIAQFRLQKQQGTVEIEEVESLENEDRGGFGSTGN